MSKLSKEAQEWLSEAIDQLMDGDGIIVNKKARQECIEAGLVTLRPFGRMQFSQEALEQYNFNSPQADNKQKWALETWALN